MHNFTANMSASTEHYLYTSVVVHLTGIRTEADEIHTPASESALRKENKRRITFGNLQDELNPVFKLQSYFLIYCYGTLAWLCYNHFSVLMHLINLICTHKHQFA